MPPATVTRNTPVATFRVVIQNPEAYDPACAEALEWLARPIFEGETMGFCMDTFIDEAQDRTTPHHGWALWNLHFWRQYCDAEIRAGFISIIWSPMAAYRLLKNAELDPAGDDWSEEERNALRAVFRGQLPNVPDADTI